MTDRLLHKQTAAMIILMALAREVPNTELRETVGFALDGKDRRALNDLGFVTSRLVKRCYVHELTDAGLAWCREEFAAATPPPPAPRSTLAPALYILLGKLHEYLVRENIPLNRIFAPGTALTPEEIEDRIRDAYRTLAPGPREWVELAALRPMLGNAPAEDVDAVLKKLSRSGTVRLIPRSNRKMLTDADHSAAVHIGGDDNHLLRIETS